MYRITEKDANVKGKNKTFRMFTFLQQQRKTGDRFLKSSLLPRRFLRQKRAAESGPLAAGFLHRRILSMLSLA
jgi:hypothetical protein